MGFRRLFCGVSRVFRRLFLWFLRRVIRASFFDECELTPGNAGVYMSPTHDVALQIAARLCVSRQESLRGQTSRPCWEVKAAPTVLAGLVPQRHRAL